MSASRPGWLALFCSSLGCHPRFQEALDEQLTRHAKALAGVDLRRRRFSLVPSEGPIQYSQRNVGVIETDLVGPDNMGHPVAIGWRCEVHPEQRVEPSEDLPPDCRLEIFWARFPIEELKGQTRPPPRTAGLDEPSIPIEQHDLVWPDVFLQFHPKALMSVSQQERLSRELDAAIARWNTRGDGLIHYRGELVPSGDSLQVHIDFGGAEQEALVSILQHLRASGAIPSGVHIRAGTPPGT